MPSFGLVITGEIDPTPTGEAPGERCVRNPVIDRRHWVETDTDLEGLAIDFVHRSDASDTAIITLFVRLPEGAGNVTVLQGDLCVPEPTVEQETIDEWRSHWASNHLPAESADLLADVVRYPFAPRLNGARRVYQGGGLFGNLLGESLLGGLRRRSIIWDNAARRALLIRSVPANQPLFLNGKSAGVSTDTPLTVTYEQFPNLAVRLNGVLVRVQDCRITGSGSGIISYLCEAGTVSRARR